MQFRLPSVRCKANIRISGNTWLRNVNWHHCGRHQIRLLDNSPSREIISHNRRAVHDELHMLQKPDVLSCSSVAVQACSMESKRPGRSNSMNSLLFLCPVIRSVLIRRIRPIRDLFRSFTSVRRQSQPGSGRGSLLVSSPGTSGCAAHLRKLRLDLRNWKLQFHLGRLIQVSFIEQSIRQIVCRRRHFEDLPEQHALSRVRSDVGAADLFGDSDPPPRRFRRRSRSSLPPAPLGPAGQALLTPPSRFS
jgi:hypothetical protein